MPQADIAERWHLYQILDGRLNRTVSAPLHIVTKSLLMGLAEVSFRREPVESGIRRTSGNEAELLPCGTNVRSGLILIEGAPEAGSCVRATMQGVI